MKHLVLALGLLTAFSAAAQESGTAAKTETVSAEELATSVGGNSAEAADKTAGTEVTTTDDAEKPAEVTAGESDPDAVQKEELSKGERQRLERKQLLEEQRSQETSRFKRRAIERAQEREERQRELLERQQEANTSFRKKAMERAEERAQEKAKKLNERENKMSRFGKKAQQRLEERRRKKMEREARRRQR